MRKANANLGGAFGKVLGCKPKVDGSVPMWPNIFSLSVCSSQSFVSSLIILPYRDSYGEIASTAAPMAFASKHNLSFMHESSCGETDTAENPRHFVCIRSNIQENSGVRADQIDLVARDAEHL